MFLRALSGVSFRLSSPCKCGSIKANKFFFYEPLQSPSVPMTPIIAFERLFFAVFGQTSPDDINSQRQSRPEWTENLFKLVYGIYMLVSVIVLINLLIAMMSDTYQRIQVITKSFVSASLFPSPSKPTIHLLPQSSNNQHAPCNNFPIKTILALNQFE